MRSVVLVLSVLVLSVLVFSTSWLLGCGGGSNNGGGTSPGDVPAVDEVAAADSETKKDTTKPPVEDVEAPGDVPAVEDDGPVAEDTPTGDTPALDTPPPPPDVDGPCLNPADCPGGACNQLTGECVGCLTDADCGEAAACLALVCVPDVPCDSDKDCKDAVCDFAQGVCVECLTDTDCPKDELCKDASCDPAPTPCESSKDCNDLGMVCDKLALVCVDCVTDADCNEGEWCGASHCAPKVCVAGFIQCAADGARTCLENGSGFGPSVACTDELPCTQDGCTAGTGCVHSPSSGPCDDLNACTDGDMCGETGCVPGAALDCADGDPCTTDTCDPLTACAHGPSSGPCDDGDACTAGDACAEGKCVPGPGPDCDDGSPCTKDACVSGLGCTHAPAAGPCDDADACTLGDFCSLGVCKPGASAAVCDDKSACTVDSCDKKKGCVYLPSTAKGCCKKASDCADGNPCTQGVCDAEGACSFPPAVASCDDGDLCTDPDVCDGGKCGGLPKDCDDKNPCTWDGCAPVSGCTHVPHDGVCGEGATAGVCFNGACCQPSCTGKTCGSNGCGGSCGACGAGTTCGAAGACVPCSCTGKTCGDDGCGTSCGTCAAGLSCTALGVCTPPEGTCTGDCTGQTTDAMLCAIDLCAKESIVSAAIASPTGSDVSTAWAAVKHFGAENNGLGPKKGASYALLATGPATGTSHSADLGGSQVADPFVGGNTMHNALELQLTLKAPAGVTGFSVRYVFFSEEFEEYVGSQFNDKFYIVVNGAVANSGPCAAAAAAGDTKTPDGQPACFIGPNTGFAEPCSAPVTDISGTGYECGAAGGQNGSANGSSTGWLRTSWPIVAGETLTLTFHIHDTGDGIFDSEVILDAFQWRTDVFTPGTAKD